MILNLFSGPGGWCVAADRLGLVPAVGVEWDAAACATRSAAGHKTIRADITALAAEPLAGRVTGFIGSPECTTFSAAGGRGGLAAMAVLDALIRDMFAGRGTRAARRAEMARALRAAGWPPPRMRASRHSRKHKTPVRLTRAQRSAAVAKAVRSASLVAEPARLLAACLPEWVALEQVPSVLPLWRAYADELRARGYHAWCGVLNAADYGVPQTRERAILIASRVRQVQRPYPTHSDARKPPQLFTEPWVSMASALGWGATGRPVPTVTAGGTAAGGAEPFGHRDRDALERERDAGRWALRVDAQAHATVRDVTAPALKFGHSAAKMQWTWRLRNNSNGNACERSTDEPAGTLFFSRRSNWAGWVRERPATTIQGDPRVGRPGHKDRDKGESQFAHDSVRITVGEAAALQSFPPGYPFQGTQTKRFEQVGNAVPPLLAIAVLGEAAGVPWEGIAAAYRNELRGIGEAA